MWIKWKYNDYGCGSAFKEIEAPDDVNEVYGSVPSWLCATHPETAYSESFMLSRIEWERIKKPSKEYLTELIRETKALIRFQMKEANRLESLLKTY